MGPSKPKTRGLRRWEDVYIGSNKRKTLFAVSDEVTSGHLAGESVDELFSLEGCSAARTPCLAKTAEEDKTAELQERQEPHRLWQRQHQMQRQERDQSQRRPLRAEVTLAISQVQR